MPAQATGGTVTSSPVTEAAAAGPFMTNDAAGAYASKIALNKKPFLEFLRTFEWKEPASDPDQQFLDIGCGTGDVTREHILPRCPPCRRIVAVDFSPKMLEYAKEHFPHPRIEYKLLDIGHDVEQFLAEHGEFQRLYSLRTLHWAKDQARAFYNIARLTAPGGECILLFLGRCDTFDFMRRMAQLEPWTKYSHFKQRMWNSPKDAKPTRLLPEKSRRHVMTHASPRNTHHAHDKRWLEARAKAQGRTCRFLEEAVYTDAAAYHGRRAKAVVVTIP
ncbi:juvenile hormone acid O-methyltransferase-like isoform X2 [Dermacentor albipictus]|uniref:juvenile hormone acid O-methyltransferase-like isoform X2 n=1 Tax=Dermacentor albipictus TaxID=60249 RepID=UPI0031FD4507